MANEENIFILRKSKFESNTSLIVKKKPTLDSYNDIHCPNQTAVEQLTFLVSSFANVIEIENKRLLAALKCNQFQT